MAKVTLDAEKAFKYLDKKLKQFTTDRSNVDKVARIILSDIKKGSRSGKGYDGEKFPSLKVTTVKRRRRLAGVNKTNKNYHPFLSNVTFMGDTINKLFYKVIGRSIFISGKGNHRYVKGIRVKKIKGSNAPIRKILGGLQSKGWKILGVSDNAKKKVSRLFRRYLRRNL